MTRICFFSERQKFVENKGDGNISCFGTLRQALKGLEKKLEEFEIIEKKIKIPQTTALIRTVRILRRAFETLWKFELQ